MAESQAIKRCVILKQVEVDFREIRRGDIFRVESTDGGNNATVSEWAMAMQDSQEDPKHPGQYLVPADRVYFVVGKPETVNHTMRAMDPPTKVLPKTKPSVGKNH